MWVVAQAAAAAAVRSASVLDVMFMRSASNVLCLPMYHQTYCGSLNMLQQHGGWGPCCPVSQPILLAPSPTPTRIYVWPHLHAVSAKAGELDQRSLDALASLPPSRALMALDRCVQGALWWLRLAPCLLHGGVEQENCCFARQRCSVRPRVWQDPAIISSCSINVACSSVPACSPMHGTYSPKVI